jgi:hypothetical protein
MRHLQRSSATSGPGRRAGACTSRSTITSAWPTPGYWADRTSMPARGFCAARVAWYADHGIAVEHVLSDNAQASHSHLCRATCAELDAARRYPALTRPAPTGSVNDVAKTASCGGRGRCDRVRIAQFGRCASVNDGQPHPFRGRKSRTRHDDGRQVGECPEHGRHRLAGGLANDPCDRSGVVGPAQPRDDHVIPTFGGRRQLGHAAPAACRVVVPLGWFVTGRRPPALLPAAPGSASRWQCGHTLASRRIASLQWGHSRSR